MPKPRGADRNTVTIPIGEDDHIVVLAELTAGEESDAWRGAVERVRDENGETVHLDRKSLDFQTAAHYIRSWSFVDRSGAPMVWPIGIADRVAILRDGLSGNDWDEVRRAVNAHEAAQEAKKKKTPDGPSAPTTT